MRRFRRINKPMSERTKTYLFMLLPALVLFAVFNTVPLITGAYYSLTNYRGYGSYDIVGLRNFIDLFQDSRIGKSYMFTFKYAIFGTVLVNVLSLLIAIGLNSKIKFKSALKGIYFLPNILVGLIVGYIFSFIFTYIIPAIGSAIGINFLENSILASERWAWVGVLIVGVWQTVAMNTIIYISGLKTIPADIYEASSIDGAGKWYTFRRLTLPLLLPFISTNLILSTKNMLMVFDQIMSLTKGGPAQSTESISYLIYRNGMDGGQFGFQSANAVVFFIVIVTFSVIQIKLTSKKEEQL